MKQWFIQIENKDNHERLSIYDDGLVYGTKRGNKLFILKPEIITKIQGILNGTLDDYGNEFTDKTYSSKVNYLYHFKKDEYTKFSDNQYILRIRDDSRNNRHIKVVGWKNTQIILSMIKKSYNWKKSF